MFYIDKFLYYRNIFNFIQITDNQNKIEVDPRAYPLANNELAGEIHNLIQRAQSLGQLICGTNQVTKQLNHQKCSLVVIAADVQPLEMVLHLVLLCEDKGCPYVFVPSQQVIGHLSGLSKSASSCCFLKSQSLESDINSLITKIEQI